MKIVFPLAGLIAFIFTPIVSFFFLLSPKQNEIRSGGYLEHTNLRDVNLIGVNLSSSNLNFSDLSGSNLTNANLSGAKLINTSLTAATLINTDLSGANLTGSDLRDAILDGANLIVADLNNTNLNGITATNLKGCPLNLPKGWVCENFSLIER